MGFQILNSEGQAISLEYLDLEARKFWHKDTQNWVYEKHPRSYTVPEKVTEDMRSTDEAMVLTSGNWFDVIGYNIHSNRYGDPATWDTVRMEIADVHIKPIEILSYFEGLEHAKTDADFEKFETSAKMRELLISLGGSYLFTKPYLDLIDYWEDKGYIPKAIKE